MSLGIVLIEFMLNKLMILGLYQSVIAEPWHNQLEIGRTSFLTALMSERTQMSTKSRISDPEQMHMF